MIDFGSFPIGCTLLRLELSKSACMIFVCRAMWRAADRALPVGLLRLMLPLLLPRRVIAVGGFTSASVALLSVVPEP